MYLKQNCEEQAEDAIKDRNEYQVLELRYIVASRDWYRWLVLASATVAVAVMDFVGFPFFESPTTE